MKNFWQNLPKPILALAPMHDVTDAAFRYVIAKYGKPHVMFTEFVSADGLASQGRPKLLHALDYNNIERPIVAQIFGSNFETFKSTAEMVEKLGFDGLDINMGCPEKNVVKSGSCAGLFRTPELARDLVLAAKIGAPNIPVSVKIRIGDNKIDWENWIATLLEAEPAAVTIHLRTRKEMSLVPAHWEEMPKIVKFIHNHTSPETRPIILGNGDVNDLEEARLKAQETNCDGVMLGRAIFGNPWLFAPLGGENPTPTRKEKLTVLLEHTNMYEQMFAGVKPFEIMKRHFKSYTSGFSGAAELREKLYACNSSDEVEAILNLEIKKELT